MKFLIYSTLLLILGSIYTIIQGRKLQAMQEVEDEIVGRVQFKAPLFQTFCLFFGMFLCLVVKVLCDLCCKKPIKKQLKQPSYAHYYAFFPAICDVFATIFDTIGLFYVQGYLLNNQTHVSVSQMLKAFLIVFTYLISKFVFNQKISQKQTIGIVFVFFGVTLIGVSNIEEETQMYATHPLLGNVLCIIAQLFISMMFIAEETIMKNQKLGALSLVGWEGLWGSLVSAFLLSMLYFFPHISIHFREDFTQVANEVYSNKSLFLALLLSSLSIGPFNYFGSKITKISSALHRSALDSLRMLCVWCYSLEVEWEQFRWLQAGGFFLLTIGVLMIGVAFIIMMIKKPHKDKNSSDEEDEEEAIII